ncbi:MAG: hypothetical protein QOF48_864 [Verrucomicrobiota bacterium]|jgi:hypothetical protein
MKYIRPLSVFAAIPLAGCLSMPPPPDWSASHPANPQAAVSPVPPLQPSLLAITNMVMLKPTAHATSEHEKDHGQHEAKPGAQEKK